MPSNLESVAVEVYNAIFEGRESVDVEGRRYHVGRTSRLGLREVTVEGYAFIEQNPAKTSAWARLAREGHKILWVRKGQRYLAQVRDGVFYDFRKKP